MKENSNGSGKDYALQSFYLLGAGGLATALTTCIGQYIGSYVDAPHLIEGAGAVKENFSLLGLNTGGLVGLVLGIGATSFGAEKVNCKEDHSSEE